MSEQRTANSSLSRAKSVKYDEFYTQYNDIEKEMNGYLEYNPNVFRNKTILLPCDDPEWSNFTKYFAQNFERFGLKKLISTSYAPNSKAFKSDYQPSLFESKNPQFDEDKTLSRGKIFTLDKDTFQDGRIDIHDLEWTYLEGDGDFRSDEIKKIRGEADIVITNPPFSLFREFLAWLIEGDVKFSILGNKNSITYKEVFPLIKNNKLWIGKTPLSVDIVFNSPEKINPSDYPASSIKKIDGEFFLRSPSTWFSNIDHGRRHENLQLMTMQDNLRFNKKMKGKDKYDHYDNYDAIEVPFTNAIPSDFNGVMGVPISFLDKYNPDQFEILGATQRGCHDDVPDFKKYDDYWEVRQNGERTGSTGGKTNENTNISVNDGKKNYFINKDGHIIQSTYQRIFIRHKQAS